MHARFTNWSLALALCATAAFTAAGCSKDNSSPTTPTGGGTSSDAAADGTTLKATAPTPSSPVDRVVVDSLRPTLRVGASQGKFVSAGGYQYRFELRDEAGNGIAGYLVNGTELTIPDSLEMSYSKVYRWRARAEVNGAFGPWSSTVEFTTPNPPSAVASGGGGAGVGAVRTIGVNEAAAIIIDVHNRLRYDLGSSSTREQRVAFLWTAVAIIHFGHPVFNPAGGDPNWCVKDAGAGRPPSDDVLVQCGSRDAWDLIGSAGANGYFWHLDYLGRLSGEQNVYPPPASSLPR
jgi:hypothetical protein